MPNKKPEYFKFIVNQLINKNIAITMEQIYLIAAWFPVKDCARFLPKNSPQARKTLSLIKEIQDRKMLGLAYSIEHKSKIADFIFSVESSNAYLQQDFLQEMIDRLDLKQHSEKLAAINVPSLKLSDKKAIIKSAHQLILNLPNYADVSQDQTKQVIRFVDTNVGDNSVGHAVAFALQDKVFCYANRGIGSNFLGIRIFNIENPDVLKKIHEYAQDGHEIGEIEDFLATLKPIIKVPMQGQKSGNCAFVACKSMYWFAVYLETLKYLEQNRPLLENKEEIAADFAKDTYKYFSTQERVYLFNDYLNNHKLDKDYTLLAKVYMKLKNKKDRTDFPVNELIFKIELQVLRKIHAAIVPILMEAFDNDNKGFCDAYQIKYIVDFIRAEKLTITAAQKEELYIKALSNLVQSPDENFILDNYIGLYHLLENDLVPDNLANLSLKLPKASQCFINYITDLNRPENKDHFIAMVTKDIAGHYLENVSADKQSIK
jgi:hypothetical protein